MSWHLDVFDALVHSAVAGFVLLAVATVVLLTIRQPARRIRVIEMTLVGLLVVPCLALVPGYPRVAVLPALESAEEAHDDENIDGTGFVVAPVDIEDYPPAKPGALESAVRLANEKPPALPGDAPPEEVPSESRLADARPSLPAAQSGGPQPPPAQPQRAETVGWQLPRDYRRWIVIGFLAGAAAMIGWSLLGLAAAWRMLRFARPASEACRAVLREIAGRKSDRVPLVISARARQPCALVWCKATIVLPEKLANSGDRRQLRWALAHEWSHVARGDVWTWNLSGVIRWFYFYQPLVWPLRRQLRLCQDFLADAAAARAGPVPEDYAEFLMSYSSRLDHSNLAAGLGFAGRVSELRRRIVMLVDHCQTPESAAPRRWNLIALPLAVLLVAAVAALGTRPETTAAAPPDESAIQDAFSPKVANEALPEQRDAALTVDEAHSPFSTGPDDVVSNSPGSPFRAAAAGDLSNDPVVYQMTQRAILLADHLNEVRGASRRPEASPYVRALQRQIDALQKSLDERKAHLREHAKEHEAREHAKEEHEHDAHRHKHDEDAGPAARAHKHPGYYEKAARTDTSRVPTYVARTHKLATPFSGRLRPGDILKVDLAGGFPTGPERPTTATVEPDGNLALGALYGRVNVGGKTLLEAEAIIRDKLQKSLKDPQVQLTYQGHNPDIVPTGRGTPRRAVDYSQDSPKKRPSNAAHDMESALDFLQQQKQTAQQAYQKAAELAQRRHDAHLVDLQRLTAEIQALTAENAELRRHAEEFKRSRDEKARSYAEQVESLLRQLNKAESSPVSKAFQRQLEELQKSLEEKKPPETFDSSP